MNLLYNIATFVKAIGADKTALGMLV